MAGSTIKRSKSRTVWRREGGRCHYCHLTVPDDQRSVDHVWPRALGGSDRNENLVAACRACNEGFGLDTDKCRCDFCTAAMRSELAIQRAPKAKTYRGRATIGSVAEVAGFKWTADGWKPYRAKETP